MQLLDLSICCKTFIECCAALTEKFQRIFSQNLDPSDRGEKARSWYLTSFQQNKSLDRPALSFGWIAFNDLSGVIQAAGTKIIKLFAAFDGATF